MNIILLLSKYWKNLTNLFCSGNLFPLINWRKYFFHAKKNNRLHHINLINSRTCFSTLWFEWLTKYCSFKWINTKFIIVSLKNYDNIITLKLQKYFLNHQNQCDKTSANKWKKYFFIAEQNNYSLPSHHAEDKANHQSILIRCSMNFIQFLVSFITFSIF